MHGALEALYRERPGGDPVPRPGSLDAWLERGERAVAEKAAAARALRRTPRRSGRSAAGSSCCSPPSCGGRRRATRSSSPRSCWRRPSAATPRTSKPALDLGGWQLHGRIDRVDVDAGRPAPGCVHDYKVAAQGDARAPSSPAKGKLQLPLYLLALRDLWGIDPAGGVYQPLRATKDPRPRGLVRASADGRARRLRRWSAPTGSTTRISRPCLEQARSTASARGRPDARRRDPTATRSATSARATAAMRRSAAASAASSSSPLDEEDLRRLAA